MKADVRTREVFLHARTRNLKQSRGHLEWGDGIAFPLDETLRDASERDCRRSHATLCRACAAITGARIFFIPLLCQWAAISRRAAVHLTRLGTLNKRWERCTWANCWRGALLDMLSVR